ncbi:MAG: DUF1428 domain-containing protein [Sphingomicrobium sp.]
MTYFEGFIVPVPDAKKAEYQKHADDFAPLLRDVGVHRMVENWDSDIPEGKLTDFRKAVDAKPEEKVVFSWFEYPSKAERDDANAKMMSDPRMMEMGANMPFDGKRLVMGGFESIVDEGSPGGNYTDGVIVPVTAERREDYRVMASKMAKTFLQHGATRVVESLADDVDHGEVTDFYRAVKAEDGETIAFSFVEWPDKATRDAAWGKIMEDESHRPQGDLPFAGQRMFWGGFDKILDTAK